MKIKSIVLLSMLIASTLSFSQVNWKNFAKDNFTLKYPENWDLDTSGQMNSKVLLFSKLSSNNDTFRENINVVIQNLQGMNIDMKRFVEITEQQIQATPNGKILENRKIDKGNSEKHLMVWKGKINTFNLKFKQYFYIKNQKAYIITYTATENEYDNYLKIADKILNSFKLTK